MTDQPTLLLETVCRECGEAIAYSGVGRPRAVCDSCRPATSLPPVKKVPEAVSRTVRVREHLRRVKGDTSPIPRHRVTDPEPSRAAARAVTGRGVERAILDVFARHVDLTDDELAACLPERYPPTIKSARSRLSGSGHLVDTGMVRASNRGHDMTVWSLRNT